MWQLLILVALVSCAAGTMWWLQKTQKEAERQRRRRKHRPEDEAFLPPLTNRIAGGTSSQQQQQQQRQQPATPAVALSTSVNKEPFTPGWMPRQRLDFNDSAFSTTAPGDHEPTFTNATATLTRTQQRRQPSAASVPPVLLGVPGLVLPPSEPMTIRIAAPPPQQRHQRAQQQPPSPARQSANRGHGRKRAAKDAEVADGSEQHKRQRARMGTSSTGSDENANTAPMDIDVFSSDSDESSGDDEEAMVGTSTTPASKRAASKRRNEDEDDSPSSRNLAASGKVARISVTPKRNSPSANASSLDNKEVWSRYDDLKGQVNKLFHEFVELEASVDPSLERINSLESAALKLMQALVNFSEDVKETSSPSVSKRLTKTRDERVEAEMKRVRDVLRELPELRSSVNTEPSQDMDVEDVPMPSSSAGGENTVSSTPAKSVATALSQAEMERRLLSSPQVKILPGAVVPRSSKSGRVLPAVRAKETPGMARSKASALLAGAPTHLVNSSDIQSKMESVFVDDDEPAPVIVPTISIVLTKPVTAVESTPTSNLGGPAPKGFGGSSSTASTLSTAATLGFPAADPKATVPSFGVAPSAPAASVAAPATFNFGGTSTAAPTPTPGASNATSTSTKTKADTASFNFGTAPPAAPSASTAPSFVFGATPAAASSTTPSFGLGATPAAASSTAPSFVFGATPAAASSTAPSFGLGATPAAVSSTAPSFGLGATPAAASSTAPSFGLGAQAPTSATAPAFNFGATASTQTTSSSFGFGGTTTAPAAAPAPTNVSSAPFTFATAAAPIPAQSTSAPSLGFGASPAPATAKPSTSNSFAFTPSGSGFNSGTAQPASKPASGGINAPFNFSGQQSQPQQQQPPQKFAFNTQAASGTPSAFGGHQQQQQAPFGQQQKQQTPIGQQQQQTPFGQQQQQTPFGQSSAPSFLNTNSPAPSSHAPSNAQSQFSVGTQAARRPPLQAVRRSGSTTGRGK